MPRTIMGVVLAHGEVTAVHLQGGWKGATVTRVERIVLPPGTIEERGSALLAAELPRADSVVAGLASDRAFCRIVELPFSDRAKVIRAAPLQAEETLPLPLEQLVCDVQVLGKRGNGSRAFLVAAETETVAELVAALEAGGLRPRNVDVSVLGLSAILRHVAPADQWTAAIDLATDLHQAVLVGPDGPRSFHAMSQTEVGDLMFEELAGLLAAWGERFANPAVLYVSGPMALQQQLETWQERLGVPVALLPQPTDVITAPNAAELQWPAWAVPLGLAMKEGYAKGASTINLLQGPFAPTHETGPWRRAAITGAAYLGLLLALWGTGVWSRASHKGEQYESLKAAVRETFRRVLPNEPIRLELSQMQTRVKELEERAESLGSLVDREVSPLSILREISERIPRDLEVEFRDFTVEEGRVRIEGSTTSFDAIDKIKADLAEHPRFATVAVSDAKAGVERNKVLFKLTITLGHRS